MGRAPPAVLPVETKPGDPVTATDHPCKRIRIPRQGAPLTSAPLTGEPYTGVPAGPLTSEPPLADTAPLTSEPPLIEAAPLTSEPTARATAGGSESPGV
ncbi:hypothetical protein [Streptomyces sp. NPDC048623]|uniref:hypothetical protein n=1 Tax=Streptomyces sp. NPDC048623 TaxID=3155761 RepID=UPI003432D070